MYGPEYTTEITLIIKYYAVNNFLMLLPERFTHVSGELNYQSRHILLEVVAWLVLILDPGLYPYSFQTWQLTSSITLLHECSLSHKLLRKALFPLLPFWFGIGRAQSPPVIKPDGMDYWGKEGLKRVRHGRRERQIQRKRAGWGLWHYIMHCRSSAWVTFFYGLVSRVSLLLHTLWRWACCHGSKQSNSLANITLGP